MKDTKQVYIVRHWEGEYDDAEPITDQVLFGPKEVDLIVLKQEWEDKYSTFEKYLLLYGFEAIPFSEVG